MSDIRALLAQERQARRVQHSNASYSKSGVLSCNVCHLNIKSEALWDGHLKSVNHRKNAQKSRETAPRSLKRKIENVEDAEQTIQVDDRGYEVDNRKKPKSIIESNEAPADIKSDDIPVTIHPSSAPSTKPVKAVRFAIEETEPTPVTIPELEPPPLSITTSGAPDHVPSGDIDEDEWAAFEKEVAPLAAPDYSGATITAAPVTAAQLKAEAEAEQKKLRDVEGEEEKEEEGRRLEEEFDVMEEMEERVRKLREKREALRLAGMSNMDTGQEIGTIMPVEGVTLVDLVSVDKADDDQEEDGDEDDEDVDDWYS